MTSKPLALTTTEAAEFHQAGRVERRRKVVLAPEFHSGGFWEGGRFHTPLELVMRYSPHATGTECWVKEPWTGTWCYESMHVVYAVDGSEREIEIPEVPIDYVLPKEAIKPGVVMSPVSMPRWASRSTARCEAVDVRQVDGVWMWCEVWERIGK